MLAERHPYGWRTKVPTSQPLAWDHPQSCFHHTVSKEGSPSQAFLTTSAMFLLTPAGGSSVLSCIPVIRSWGPIWITPNELTCHLNHICKVTFVTQCNMLSRSRYQGLNISEEPFLSRLSWMGGLHVLSHEGRLFRQKEVNKQNSEAGSCL